MYYERTQTGPWTPNNSKQVLFNKSTYPLREVPALFWNNFRKPAASIPGYNSATHKLVGPQDLGDGFVGFTVEPLTPLELAEGFKAKTYVFTAAVQQYLDTGAQSRYYDNIFTVCTYINSSDPVFKAEATAALAWRDEVWLHCGAVLAAVEAGGPEPTVEELLAELPALNW